MKLNVKNYNDIVSIRKSAIITSKSLGIAASFISPGMTGIRLNNIITEYIRDNYAIPAFLGLYGFPYSICVSVNNVVVHGVPNKIPFKEKDIISIDCGVLYKGFYSDCAYTFGLCNISKKCLFLLNATKMVFNIIKKKINIYSCIGDIGYIIQSYIESNNFSVVKSFVGHSIGKKLHEDPIIPNYGIKNTGIKLYNGLVMCIEPMVNIGSDKVKYSNDKWSIITNDNKFSAHFEKMFAVYKDNLFELSTFKYINSSIKKNSYIV